MRGSGPVSVKRLQPTLVVHRTSDIQIVFATLGLDCETGAERVLDSDLPTCPGAEAAPSPKSESIAVTTVMVGPDGSCAVGAG